MSAPAAAFGPYTPRPAPTQQSFSLRSAVGIAFSLKIAPPKETP